MREWVALITLGRAALVAALALLALGTLPEQDALAQGDTIYVDVDATGANDGSSWENAYTTLQPALEHGAGGEDIWVAEGTYTPTYQFSPGDPRSATFQLRNGVALYGGFDPTVGDTGLVDRDWVGNVTVLSGDIGIVGNPGDNSYHVFYHPLELALDGTAILDGFAVTGGNANGALPVHDHGGGMYNHTSSPTVANCTFSGNSADAGGGGMCNAGSSPTITNCTFSNNSANWDGGGIYSYAYSSPALINCTFSDNSATNGGGMYNVYSSPSVINCTFSNNSVIYGGGGIRNINSLPTVTNCILWGDTPNEIFSDDSQPTVTYSDIQGGYEGAGNIDEDPRFVDAVGGNYHLRPGSPCIDAGTNDAPDLPDYDIEGDPRILDGDGNGVAIVDMGVDEAFWYTVYLPLVRRGF